VRENQILSAPGRYRHPARRPCRESGCGNHGLAQMAGPDGTATLIDQLRADGTALIYDPVGRTLRADGHDAPSVTIGRDRWHPRIGEPNQLHILAL
jgi:hypothetical protein